MMTGVADVNVPTGHSDAAFLNNFTDHIGIMQGAAMALLWQMCVLAFSAVEY